MTAQATGSHIERISNKILGKYLHLSFLMKFKPNQVYLKVWFSLKNLSNYLLID